MNAECFYDSSEVVDSVSDIVSSGDSPGQMADTAVGLSDPQYAGHRRRMLALINRLRNTG